MKREPRKTEGSDPMVVKPSLLRCAIAVLKGEQPENATAALFEQAKVAMARLQPRESLRLIGAGGDTAESLLASVARVVAPFDSFSSKKVRFNVYPRTEASLHKMIEDGHAKSKRDALDIVLEFLLDRLPANYWDETIQVKELLSSAADVADEKSKPTSLAIGGLGHALLKDLGDQVSLPLGDVLNVAVTMWIADLAARKASLESVAAQLHAELDKVDEAVSRIKEIAPEDSEGIDMLDWVVLDIRQSIDARVKQGAVAKVMMYAGNCSGASNSFVDLGEGRTK